MAVAPAPPAASVAAASDTAASALGQPASSADQQNVQTDSDSSNIDEWIRDRASGQSSRLTLNPDGVVPTADLANGASGESAPSGDVSPGDVPPGDDGSAGATHPQGRRSGNAAANLATIESLQAELETLRSSIPEQVTEAQRRADEARAEAEQLRAQQATAESASYEMVGTLDELRRLQDIPFDEISNEDYQTRERWLANRKVFNPVQKQLATEEQARASTFVNNVRAHWAARVLEVADKRGLDRAFIADPKNADLDTLLEHACSTTEARVRAEYAERVSQVERDRDTARGEAIGGRRSPILNGAASGGAANSDDMDHWIRQRAGLA